MTDLERIKKDVVEMDSRANVCWYDTKVLTKAVRLILGELTADRKTELNCSEIPNNCEPQTCSVNGRPYSECADCEYFKCTADEPQTEYDKYREKIRPHDPHKYGFEDEPQTCDHRCVQTEIGCERTDCAWR